MKYWITIIMQMNSMPPVVSILKVGYDMIYEVDVSAVVNYSMPTSVSNYVHRIGRTARAQNVGTALSFVDMKNEQNTKILVEIQKYNPPRNGKPSPQCLPFDIKEIESFTYR